MDSTTLGLALHTHLDTDKTLIAALRNSNPALLGGIQKPSYHYHGLSSFSEGWGGLARGLRRQRMQDEVSFQLRVVGFEAWLVCSRRRGGVRGCLHLFGG